MNQGQVVNYKIYLCAAGYEPEIRRITIDKDICHNYFYLKQKLISIFPTLKDVQFAISWKDREGDMVRICTDEELVIALKEMEGVNVYKIYVSTTTPQGGGEGPVHTDVYCDGCEQTIQGFRYKCIVCADFDLCPDCERSQAHPDHPMLRIPLPLSPDMPFSRRFGKDLHKMWKHLEYLLKMSERWESRGERRGEGERVRERGRGERERRGAHRQCSFREVPEVVVKSILDMFEGTGHFLSHPPNSASSTSVPQPSGQAAPESTSEPRPSSAPAPPPPVSQPSSFDEQKKFVEILRQGLNFIDPLGQADGVSNRGEPATEKPSSSTLQPESSSQSLNENMREEGVAAGVDREVRGETPVLDSTWTVINNRESDQQLLPPPLQPTQQPLQPTQQPLQPTQQPLQPTQQPLMPAQQPQQPQATIYPAAIPVMPINSSGQNVVDEAVKQMVSMGFSAEGGWLRQLVESKGGDIEEVIRFLSPIQKSSLKK